MKKMRHIYVWWARDVNGNGGIRSVDELMGAIAGGGSGIAQASVSPRRKTSSVAIPPDAIVTKARVSCASPPHEIETDFLTAYMGPPKCGGYFCMPLKNWYIKIKLVADNKAAPPCCPGSSTESAGRLANVGE